MDVIRLFADGFPLTIERLQFLQNTYAKAFSQLSKVAGSGNIIIDGVELDDPVTPTTVTAGVIIVDGELLEFEAGAYDARVAVFETVNQVPYNIDDDNDGNLDLKVADVVRTAKCAATGGVDAFTFDTLKRVGNLFNLMPQIGDVKLITRAYDPLVDIGWELLDMSDTFIMGAGGTHSVNGTGGENSHVLSEAEMPAHNHTGSTNSAGAHTHTYTREDTRGSGSDGAEDGVSSFSAASTSSAGAHTHTLTINNKGGGAAHENRPKFRAFNFLIFVGF